MDDCAEMGREKTILYLKMLFRDVTSIYGQVYIKIRYWGDKKECITDVYSELRF